MVRLEWKPQYLWIGVYWKRSVEKGCYNNACRPSHYYVFDIWVCVLPCLPIHFVTTKRHLLRSWYARP